MCSNLYPFSEAASEDEAAAEPGAATPMRCSCSPAPPTDLPGSSAGSGAAAEAEDEAASEDEAAAEPGAAAEDAGLGVASNTCGL